MKLTSRFVRPPSLALAVLGLSALVYILSIDVHPRNLYRENFVFDADVEPVVGVIASGHLRNLRRHPLYATFLGIPGSAIDSLVDDPLLTARCVTTVAAAFVSLLAFWFFDRLLAKKAEAVLFCLLSSLSASVWLLGAVPETHIFNYASVVAGFFLLQKMIDDRGGGKLPRYTLTYVVAAVFLTGITLTNIFYVTLSFLLALLNAPISFARRAKFVVVYSVSVILLLWVFSTVQSHFHPRELNLFAQPSAPLETKFLKFDRTLSADTLWSQARFFLYNNIVGSPPEVQTVPTLSGDQQMIQLGKTSRFEMLIIAYLLVVLAVLLSKRSKRVLGPSGLMSLAVLVFCLALHFFFRGNGQPFIFSIQTVFPIVVLLALLYRASASKMKLLFLAGLVCMIVANNALFLYSVNGLLSRRCLNDMEYEHTICTLWDGEWELRD